MFQDLPSRIEGRVNERSIRSKRRRYHPKMVYEIVHMVMEQPGDPTGLLIAISFFREDYPWLYEIGLDAYRAINNNDFPTAKSAAGRFRRAVKFTLHGPYGDEFGIESKEMHMLMHEIPMIFDEIMDNCIGYMMSTVKQNQNASTIQIDLPVGQLQ